MRFRRSFSLVFVVGCVVAGLAADRQAVAGWASLGDMPRPTPQAKGLLFHSDQGTLWVGAENDQVLRVRFAPRASLGRDHSYALTSPRPQAQAPVVQVGETQSVVKVPGLSVTINHKPLRLTFRDATGTIIDEDDADRGIAFTGTTTRVWKTLPDDAHVYGLGEKGGRLDKRGRNLGGTTYTMWNNDTFAYDSDTDPIYVSVPFFMVMRKARAHGVFLDNTFRSSFDVGHESQRLLSFGAEAGELNYYVIAGPHPKDVVARYTELTGRITLPPQWALGFHQSRWGYWPESRLRLVANSFREKKIPADVLWLDIDYQDGFKPFTWDKTRFPDPPRMLKELGQQGFRVITIVDPHPPEQKGYSVFDQGASGGHFIRSADGSLFTGAVWPMRATPPRRSVYPDFTKPSARQWWAGLYKPFLDMGVAGIWNDMNEPAVGDQPNGTMPFDVRHDNDGQPSDHREVHNVYGQQMSRATFDGIRAAKPNQRPFVLTRASFAGGQKWSAVWTGDNQSDWAHLRGGIPMLLGMGLSGFSFVGNDVGGFVDSPTPTLFTRWAQAAVFFPFMRAHTTRRSLDQEPWSYGVVNEIENRKIIELRYRLLPTIYNEMQKASATGVPAMRPLFLEFPEDAATWDRDDEFMWGQDILVAPVLKEVAVDREVYLPPGDWYEFATGALIAAAKPAAAKAGDETALSQTVGQTISVPVSLSTLPVYVRPGGVVFSHPVVQHTGQLPGQPLQVTVYPSNVESTRTFYEDDGETMAYAKGGYCSRSFRSVRRSRQISVAVSACEGKFRPRSRDMVVRVPALGATHATLNGKMVPVRGSGPGWVEVQWLDGFAAAELSFTLDPSSP
ncbi:MAG: glycoside hydrolase family 31 protein [Deltaproteobacteria bacterium]|nr:glycoside hydrolase family 31 protein [Deltaproteobacteria bacterium]